MKSEHERRSNNREKVLQYLRVRQDHGATNAELQNIGGFRYGARIFELRRDGWEIETIPLAGGSYRFILKGQLHVQQTLFNEPARHEPRYPD